ncbi:hypothetical protein ADL09_02975 [Streptomyces sp. NRRL F-7442]|nr:hypothetical protein ADL09_02975 [Streptomyces sp. NRRL F-7442]
MENPFDLRKYLFIQHQVSTVPASVTSIPLTARPVASGERCRVHPLMLLCPGHRDMCKSDRPLLSAVGANQVAGSDRDQP